MRIRNMRKFALYLPYAGLAKGNVVQANGLSVELPTDRFYDVLLQRDWKRGNIQITLNDMDKAILGESVVAMFNEPSAPAAQVTKAITAADVIPPVQAAATTPEVVAIVDQLAKEVVEEAKAKEVIEVKANDIDKVNTEPIMKYTDPTHCSVCDAPVKHPDKAIEPKFNRLMCRLCKIKVAKGWVLAPDGNLVRSIKPAKIEYTAETVQAQPGVPTIPKPTIGKVETADIYKPSAEAPPPSGIPSIEELTTYNRGVAFGASKDMSPGHGLGAPAIGGPKVDMAVRKVAAAKTKLQGPIGSPLATMSQVVRPQARIEG